MSLSTHSSASTGQDAVAALWQRAQDLLGLPLLLTGTELAVALADGHGRIVSSCSDSPVLCGTLGAELRSALRAGSLLPGLWLLQGSAVGPPDRPGQVVQVPALSLSAAAAPDVLTLVAAWSLSDAPSDAACLAIRLRWPQPPTLPTGLLPDLRSGVPGLSELPPAVGPRYAAFAASASLAQPPRTAQFFAPILPASPDVPQRLAPGQPISTLPALASLPLGPLRLCLDPLADALRAAAATLAPHATALSHELSALWAQQTAAAAALWDSLPRGVYAFADSLDDDGAYGADLPLRAQLQLTANAPLLDLRDCAPSLGTPLELSVAATVSVFAELLRRLLLRRGVPTSCGFADAWLSGLQVRYTTGTLVSSLNATCGVGHDELAERVFDVSCGLLSQAIPRQIGAAAGGTRSAVYIERASGAGWIKLTMPCGTGGSEAQSLCALHPAPHWRAASLSPDALAAAWQTEDIRLLGCVARADSAGGGVCVGGDGFSIGLALPAGRRIALWADRRRRPPHGLAGGGPGLPGSDVLLRDQQPLPLLPKTAFIAAPGDQLWIETPGGGGYGDAQRAAFFASLLPDL